MAPIFLLLALYGNRDTQQPQPLLGWFLSTTHSCYYLLFPKRAKNCSDNIDLSSLYHTLSSLLLNATRHDTTHMTMKHYFNSCLFMGAVTIILNCSIQLGNIPPSPCLRSPFASYASDQFPATASARPEEKVTAPQPKAPVVQEKLVQHMPPVAVADQEKKQAPAAPAVSKQQRDPPEKEAPRPQHDVQETPKKEPQPLAQKEEAKPVAKKEQVKPGEPSNMPIPPPGPKSTYDWSDVNLSVMGNCGWHKCFFPSKSNSTKEGYLVVSSSEYNAMKEADDVAHELTKRFGSKHFHLALDTDTPSNEFKNHINKLVVQPGRAAAGQDSIPILDDKHDVVIQKVLLAPEPALFFAVMNNNYRKSLTLLDPFNPKIPDKNSFAENLYVEQARLVKVLEWRPFLVRDLQALIDIHGNFYHIDLDGHIHLRAEPLEAWEIPRAEAGLLQVITNVTKGGEVAF